MKHLDARKKPVGVAIIYSLFMLMFLAASHLGMLLGDIPWVFGAVLMACAVPVALCGGKRRILYPLAILMNAIGTGFIASYYYVASSLSLDIVQTLIPTLAAIAFIWLMALGASLAPPTPLLYAPLGIVLFGLLCLFGVLWAVYGSVQYSYSFFLLIILASVTVLTAVTTAGEDEDELLRDSAFASFGILIIVGIVVAIALGADGCDCDPGGADCCTGKGRKKKK